MKKQYKVIVGVLIGIILLITIIKVFNIKQIILQKIYPKKYSEYVEKYAQEFNVDPLLIFSMIKAESIEWSKGLNAVNGGHGKRNC